MNRQENVNTLNGCWEKMASITKNSVKPRTHALNIMREMA
jgi:hypothetical protein